MENFEPNKIKTEDLENQYTEDDGTIVFGTKDKVQENSIEQLNPEIKSLIEEIKVKGVSLGELLMIKREVNRLIGEGISKDIISNSIEDVLVEEYKKEIKSIDDSVTGISLKDRIKEELINLGVNSDKLVD